MVASLLRGAGKDPACVGESVEHEELLWEHIGRGIFRDADALLLDLRGLMGGASP